MEEAFLYHQIADAIRKQILLGELKPRDRLPSVREMAVQWSCTPGTIQRAYQELARQGLVTSRAGQGTRVVEKPLRQDEIPLRRAALIHRAETFLLEVLTAGYTPGEVEESVRQALDRWRVVEQESVTPAAQTLRFTGSHDLAVAWLGTHFQDIVPGHSLLLSFTGSLGGLIALAEGKADLAGCHLWDEETDTYNAPFVRRLLPGKRVALLTLAHRRIGLVVPAGNPTNVHGLPDVARTELHFVNRQSGSGTRVWLDAHLRKLGISPKQIQGYIDEKMTHSDISRTIAEGQADIGLGLEASAQTFGLGFIPLAQERYDLVIPAPNMETLAIQALVAWLSSRQARDAIAILAGYDTNKTGSVVWVE
jgi:molybdate-binding protein/DNA-binding transcriptional regulator YhcF (GntR family)